MAPLKTCFVLEAAPCAVTDPMKGCTCGSDMACVAERSRAMSECGRSDGRRSLDEPPAGWLPAAGARHMPKHHPGFQGPIDLSVEGVKR